MRHIIAIALIVCISSGCGLDKTGWTFGGYQVVNEHSYLKIGGVSTEIMLQERLNGIKYEERKFDIDILDQDGVIVGVYYSKHF